MKFLIIFTAALGLCQGQRGASNSYSSPGGEGGIFSTGYISENAEFGNTFSAQNFQPSYAGRSGGGGAGGAGADNIAMLEKAVPGIPGQDYPILAEVPETAFSCNGQVDGGYYADPDAQCQVFHICTSDGQGGLTKYSFLCPNGTIFNQQYFICDWWFNFDCSEAQGLYSLNAEIAAEREAATQALLASASSSQSTYVSRNGASPAQSNYGVSPVAPPQPSAPRAPPAPAGGSYQAPRGGSGSSGPSQPAGGYKAPSGGSSRGSSGSGGNGNRKSGGPARRNGGGSSKGGAAPANSNYGAPRPSGGGSASAGSGYGAPTGGSGFAGGSSAGSNYGAPSSQGGSNFGASAAPAGSSYGAPASSAGSSYGAPDASAGSSYGAPESFTDDNLPSYGR